MYPDIQSAFLALHGGPKPQGENRWGLAAFLYHNGHMPYKMATGDGKWRDWKDFDEKSTIFAQKFSEEEKDMLKRKWKEAVDAFEAQSPEVRSEAIKTECGRIGEEIKTMDHYLAMLKERFNAGKPQVIAQNEDQVALVVDREQLNMHIAFEEGKTKRFQLQEKKKELEKDGVSFII